jgi:hypothetical protein
MVAFWNVGQSMAPSILIADPSYSIANLLRSMLVTSGSNAHICGSYKAALMLLKSKKIDSVVVPFDAAKETIEFCAAVIALGVPLVYVASNQANTAIDVAWNNGGTHASSRGWDPPYLAHDGS